MAQNPFAGIKGKSATDGPLDPSAGDPLAKLLPPDKQGSVFGLVKAIDTTPVGHKITVTQDVKDAGQSLGDILGSSGEGGG
ncbi:hypothetical protein [Streptomyces sp. WAC 01529]|uniref:hypothetical protein n=1 Tax=Streptomyces sp. WAC 01529 TaxID=2203205 RepID=UPI000F742CE4|nr:hypothetical protein [Streptomyces sp. WAC 01529]